MMLIHFLKSRAIALSAPLILSALFVLFYPLLMPGLVSGEPPAKLDRLLSELKDTRKRQIKFDRKREAEFRAKRDRQAELLATAQSSLAKERKLNEELRKKFDSNEEELSELKQSLRLRAGDLGEISGTLRQVAEELSSKLRESLISGQFPKRADRLLGIAKGAQFPNREILEELWHILLQEMIESGKTLRFKAKFQAITLYGTGDPKLMAGGISEALVTTMLGLLVAIPLLFLNSLLLSKSKTLIQILYQQSAGMIVKRNEDLRLERTTDANSEGALKVPRTSHEQN